MSMYYVYVFMRTSTANPLVWSEHDRPVFTGIIYCGWHMMVTEHLAPVPHQYHSSSKYAVQSLVLGLVSSGASSLHRANVLAPSATAAGLELLSEH